MTRYIVYERTDGGECWTMAPRYQWDTIIAEFTSIADAEKWVDSVHSKRLGWWAGLPNQRKMHAHIAKVELPE